MKKRLTNSLRFRIIAGVFSILFLLMLLMIFNNVYAIHVIRGQVHDSNKKTLSMYMNQVDAGFSDVETYLAGFSYNNSNLATIENPNQEIDRYTTLYREQQSLIQTLAGYSTIDGLFMYSTPGPFFIDAVQTRIRSTERSGMKRFLINLLDTNDTIIAQNAGQWFPVNNGGVYYLCRILKIRNTYIGAWVKVDTLTTTLKESGYNPADWIFFCQDNGIPLDSFLQKEGLTVSTEDSLRRFTLAGNQARYLIITQPSIHGKYYIVALIQDNNVLEGLGTFQPIVFIVIIGIVLVTVLLAITLRRFMVRPLNRLETAIHSLKDGNLDVKITDKKPCQEFTDVYQAFGDMTSQIKHLKIDVYEEKLSRQKIQLQYLQQQVAPHFFINCLSTIYSLAGAGKSDLVQQISLDLSNHLRYTLSNTATVTLGEEIGHVRNYLQLSQLRFPDNIACDISIPKEIEMAKIPTLLLQTFVENTIKYEVVAGELTTIHIIGKKIVTKNREQIHLLIWDTGEGFPPDFLKMLNSEEWKPQKDGKKIGLYNIIQRLRLIYGENISIRFSNREGAGAQIDIIIPFEEMLQGGNQ